VRILREYTSPYVVLWAAPYGIARLVVIIHRLTT
jgi:hypothetical protein